MGAVDQMVGAVDQGGANPGRPVAVAEVAEAEEAAEAAEAAEVAAAEEVAVGTAEEAPWVASTSTLVALEEGAERARARVPRRVALLALVEGGRLSKLPAYC